MYEQSTDLRRLETCLDRLKEETKRSMTRIEGDLNRLSEKLRALTSQVESDRSSAELNRWFWLLMLLSAVLNLTVCAMLKS